MSHNTGPQSHILRSVPQPNVSIFRDRFPPPLSQIEQFSSPIASPHRSKPVSRAKATQISDISSFSHVGEGDKSVKSHSSDKGSREPPVDNTQFPANEENNENNTGNIGDDDLSQNNDESPISYRAETPVVISRPVNTASEDARPTAPEVSLIPIRRSMSLKLDSPDEPKQWRSSLAAKDAIITSLETRIQILQKEREVREQSFQTSIREHVLSKSALEEQVLSLTSALKQLSGSLPDTVNLVQQEQRMSLEPLEPTDLVRRADDEALIAQLNAEVSKLQDQLLHAQRAKANSDAMVEQVRDVARRAEATKMDLVRQSRIDREVALNAPKIAEELHMTALAEAQMTIDRQKVQIAILEEQHQLTGDIIRKKAAKFDGLQKRYQKLTIDHDELVDRLYNADDARAESASQLAHIRNVVAKISEALGNRESFAQVPGILSEILSQHLEPGADTGTMGSSEEEEEGEEGDDQDMEGVSTTTGLSLGTDIMGVNFDEDPREQNRPTLFIQELIGNVEPGIELSFPDAVESPEPVLVERSDDQVFPCLWHPSDDVCKAYHSTKEDLLGHIFRDHLNF
ncbi:hypothetical protein FRC20_005371 [Serendipita sp. 405]|nr:hypothetical protein FRC20_005371 [Serendipita sp. 405]